MPVQIAMDRDYEELFEAIDSCYGKALQLPCLVLIYTSLDSLGWLAFGDAEASAKVRFVKWVERFLLPRFPSEASALDLYAARCSVLHGLSWESSLTESGKAKHLIYTMGKGAAEAASASSTIFNSEVVACIHVDALIRALKAATADFYKSASSDAALASRIDAARGKRFAKIPIADYNEAVQRISHAKGI